MNSSTKQAVHAALLLATIALCTYFALEQSRRHAKRRRGVDLIAHYGFIAASVLYALRYAPLLSVVQTACQLIGMLVCKCFTDGGGGVQLRQWALDARGGNTLPPLCFRVVTRGDNETLVQNTVRHNLATLLAAGVSNFRIEVVTDRRLRLAAADGRITQTVVPRGYSTPRGSLYKGRALHYALAHSGATAAADWLVHLDEETLLDRSSVRGILNFVARPHNRCALGQGTIDYRPAGGTVQCRLLNCCDASRVALDHGAFAFALAWLHRPIYGLKGSFLVARTAAESAVGFDGGPSASLTEDCYFALRADSLGYAVGHIEGEMHEQSPFTVADFVRQRKRWFLGIMLTLTTAANEIRLSSKIFLIVYILAGISLPYVLFGKAFLCRLLPPSRLVDAYSAFTCSLGLYMYAFGAVKNSAAACGESRLRLAAMVVCTVLCMPLCVALEVVAMQSALAHFLCLSAGYGSIGFHVVKKQL